MPIAFRPAFMKAVVVLAGSLTVAAALTLRARQRAR